MIDLKIAKNRLQTKESTLVIVKNGQLLFETKENRIKGFLEAIEKIGNSLNGSAIADKVVGKAIALLCVYAKVAAVYAKVISIEAKSLFEKHKINHEWSIIAKEILNFEKNRPCPFEMKAKNMTDPEKTYFELKNLLEILTDCKESYN
jgi:hypothetical protein